MTKATMKQAAYAQHQGVSRKTVTIWKQSGYLVFEPSGQIDVAASDAKLVGAGVRIQSVTFGSKKGQVSALTADTQVTNDAVSALSQFGTLADAEKAKETYLALLRKLEYDEKSREVVRTSAVAKIVGAEYAHVRSRFMGIGAAVAPLIATMNSPEEVRDAIARVITEALEELAHGDSVKPVSRQ